MIFQDIFIIIFFLTIFFTSIVLITYLIAVRQLNEIKENYRMLAVANFLDQAADFFTGKTAELLEEVIYYFRIKGGRTEAKNVTDKVYERLNSVIEEIEDLLDSAKETYKLDMTLRRIREIMMFFIIIAVMSLVFTATLAFNLVEMSELVNSVFIGLDSLLFSVFVMSGIFISKTISEINKTVRRPS